MITGLQLVNAVKATPSLDVNIQVVYGLSDQTAPPFISVDNLKSVPEYDTGGVAFTTWTFDVHLFDKDFANIQTTDGQVSGYLNGLALTSKTMHLFYEGTDTIEEQLYVYHRVQHYRLFESA